jgi:hypothetical protein
VEDGLARGAGALDALLSIHLGALGNVDVAVLALEDEEPLVHEHAHAAPEHVPSSRC